MSRFILSALVLVVGCGPGGAAETVRPKDPTAENVLGEEKVDCRSVASGAQPLVVDWKPEQRGDLEVAMKDGLAVVHYGCDGIKLLADCKVDGEYGFIGMTRKEQVVRLENADELHANLPLSGGAIGGGMERGSTIDIAMVMVGKRRTTWNEPAKDDLKGSCDGATHYVRGAVVGAFAVETGTRAKVRAAAEVFAASVGGESSSAKNVKNRDGDPSACQKASPNADTPPDQCGAPIRIVLAPISAGAAAETVAAKAAPERACPEGLVLADGKCTKAETATAYQCEIGNQAECKAQCDKGHAGSCAALGNSLRGSDAAGAEAAFAKACEGGDAAGCTGLGSMKNDSAALEKGCNGGDPAGCRHLGIAYRDGKGVTADENRAATLLEQACDGGDDIGCAEAAKITKDAAKSAKLHKRACDGSVGESCNAVAEQYETGSPAAGVGKNPIMAQILYRRGCYRGSANACVGLGRALLADKSAGREQEAKMAFQRACTSRAILGCAALKVMFGAPQVVVPEPKLKMELTQSCAKGNARACADVGLLDAASGPAGSAKHSLERACRSGVPFGCSVLEKVR